MKMLLIIALSVLTPLAAAQSDVPPNSRFAVNAPKVAPDDYDRVCEGILGEPNVVERVISLFPPEDVNTEKSSMDPFVTSDGRLVCGLNDSTIRSLSPGLYEFVIPSLPDRSLQFIVGNKSHHSLGERKVRAAGDFKIINNTSGVPKIQWISLRSGNFRSPLSAFPVVFRALSENHLFPRDLEVRSQDYLEYYGQPRVLVTIHGSQVEGTPLLRELLDEEVRRQP